VLVTGSSAGGMASFMWANYIQSLVNNPYNVVAATDSNIFMRFKAY